jgi:hypothetical protein
MTPTHWAYEMVQAVLGGDSDFIDSLVKSHAHAFDVSFLSEPLGGSGQSILHVAALMNRPAIVSTLLGAADRALHAQAVQQKLSIRHETLVNKAEAVDAAETRVKLAKELDKVDRVSAPPPRTESALPAGSPFAPPTHTAAVSHQVRAAVPHGHVYTGWLRPHRAALLRCGAGGHGPARSRA